jgi:hypothetical protein
MWMWQEGYKQKWWLYECRKAVLRISHIQWQHKLVQRWSLPVAYWILASALCAAPIKWYVKLSLMLIWLNGLVILRNVFNLQPSNFLLYLNTSWMVSLFLSSFNCGPALISSIHSTWPWDFCRQKEHREP